MFDKLIESNSEGAEFKNRRSYFMVSTIFVGVLFLAAVVASIYAGEIGIGGDFEVSELLAPIEMAAVEPEQPRPEPARSQSSETRETTRNSNMARTDESTFAPDTTSTVPNTGRARPNFDFQITDGPESDGGSPRGTGGNAGNPATGTGLSQNTEPRTEPIDDIAPPPVVKPKQVSLGVINGKASYLPIPVYPAAATALNLQGKVDVQVTIDENGKVISAKAASGNPLLRQAAEKAAWTARFTPTLLSHVPVKVTGVIVYNFTRN